MTKRTTRKKVIVETPMDTSTVNDVIVEEITTNLNELATEITIDEGGKKSTNVAQVKEVLRRLNDLTLGKFYKWVKNAKN